MIAPCRFVHAGSLLVRSIRHSTIFGGDLNFEKVTIVATRSTFYICFLLQNLRGFPRTQGIASQFFRWFILKPSAMFQIFRT